ncbi:Histone acetyltransferase HPA2 [Moritella sp. JT01]|uniref:GNAT family N-acetyltransferase n=1 Tax=Moritella sp. JT01 TaxID=756698 RepID=UPI0007964932|nr:GNAT family N-acetyltransferase [Moritella sp. JT01]KXO09171.1 Histone acetyltransferase HPA2 [Moritella sp. JT01]
MRNQKLYSIKRALFPKDLKDVLCLYREYISSTKADLGFQNNEKDFLSIAELYEGESSQIFLASDSERVLGCAAFRRYDDDCCEMKRVYVCPQARGIKLGETLVRRLLLEAKTVGYKKMCLDVLPEFKAAYKLYKNMGFDDHEPITSNPVQGTKYLAINLEAYNKASHNQPQ